MMIGARQWPGGADSAGSFIDVVHKYGGEGVSATWTETHEADPEGGYPAEPRECIRITDPTGPGVRRMVPGDWLGLFDAGGPGSFEARIVVLRPVDSAPATLPDDTRVQVAVTTAELDTAPAPVPSGPVCDGCGHRPSLHVLRKGFDGGPYHPAAPFSCVGPDGAGCGEQCADFVGNAMFVAGRLVDG